VRPPPPTFDQHTDEILSGVLGYSKERMTYLREKKALGGRPDPSAFR